ncbi:hypothetical protein OG394_02225 [Kribbella sp. NBC_01245]|nr:hypothetical protein [Kribbella sp. NBC_01245]
MTVPLPNTFRRGRAVPSDHYLPEEAPGEVVAELSAFLTPG